MSLAAAAEAGLILHDPPETGFPERPPVTLQGAFGAMPKVVALVPSLLVLPFLVAGTPYYAAVPTRLGRRLCRAARARMVEPPKRLATNRVMQWHPRSDADLCHRWMRNVLREVASALD